MDRAYAEFVSDAVFRAHQFCVRAVSQLISQLGNVSSGFFIDMCRKLVCDILLIGNLVKWKRISAGLSVEDVFFNAYLLVQLFGDGASDAIEPGRGDQGICFAPASENRLPANYRSPLGLPGGREG